MQLALSVKKSRSITELNNQIVRMQQHLEDQSTEAEKLKKQLQKAYEDMNEIRNLYEEECKKNEILTERWNSRFSDYYSVNAIVEITKEEHISVYDDVKSLIRDNNRFSIDNIMAEQMQPSHY